MANVSRPVSLLSETQYAAKTLPKTSATKKNKSTSKPRKPGIKKKKPAAKKKKILPWM